MIRGRVGVHAGIGEDCGDTCIDHVSGQVGVGGHVGGRKYIVGVVVSQVAGSAGGVVSQGVVVIHVGV